ncbi:MAG: hypothetical protein V2I35_08995 [Desulfocapsaceae bacterium]|nr:hypothetical protein [Desulfocapsaceae bacterium]
MQQQSDSASFVITEKEAAVKHDRHAGSRPARRKRCAGMLMSVLDGFNQRSL